MPAPQRRPDLAVIQQLLRSPQQFGFFQAVRLLDRWLSDGAPGGQGLTRLQFRNSLALSFPPSEIESLQIQLRPPEADADADTDPAPGTPAPLIGDLPTPHEVDHLALTPAFMGLLGVAGALPLHYTETLSQRELYQKDGGPRAFMDIFSHRAVMLFYEAWRKHRLPIQFEADRRQRYLPLVMALAGMAGASDHMRRERADASASHTLPDESVAYFAGALQQRTRPVGQLQRLLQQHLGIPVGIEQFVGRWYTLPRSHLPVLGGLGGPGGAPAVLGQTMTLGERVWQRDLRLRVVLGPLSHARYLRFLPGGSGARALRDWLILLCGMGLEYEVRLQLRQSDTQGLSLHSQRPAAQGRLGWDSFLLTREATSDRGDVSYDIQTGGHEAAPDPARAPGPHAFQA